MIMISQSWDGYFQGLCMAHGWNDTGKADLWENIGIKTYHLGQDFPPLSYTHIMEYTHGTRKTLLYHTCWIY